MSLPLKNAGLRAVHYFNKLVYPLIPVPEPKLIAGAGSIKQVPQEIKSLSVSKVLVVSDKGLSAIGLVDKITDLLQKNNIPFIVFDEVQPNPSIDNIEAGLQVFKNNQCDGLIALGGGSPMDCAKLIGARVARPKKPISKMRGKLKILRKLPPFIAIPTTAGTGSETTIAAVVTDSKTHEKFAVVDLSLAPDVAILDPELMVNLPPHITSTTGMDALTHAVEAYIGLHGTKYTNEKAEKAVKIIIENLEAVVKDGSDIEKRNQMALASFYGGAAFTRASVGYVHAIAHNLGGLYGVPHGLANAIVLPFVLEASQPQANKKLAALASIANLGESSAGIDALADRFIKKIESMNQNMGIPNSVAELKEADVPLIVERAMAESNLHYPVPKILNRAELTNLVTRLLPK